MTITKAIKMAKKNITETQSWNEEVKMWVQEIRPAGIDKVYFLRNRRIEYALALLGKEVTDLDLQQPGGFEELVRRYAKEG